MPKPTTSRMSCGFEGGGRIGGHRLGADAHRARRARVRARIPANRGSPPPRRRSADRPSAASSRRPRASATFITSSSVTRLSEQGQRIVGGVAARLRPDLGEGRELRAILLHMREAGAAEIAQSERQLLLADKALAPPRRNGRTGSAGLRRRRRSRPAAYVRNRRPARIRPRRSPPPGAQGTARSSRSSNCC